MHTNVASSPLLRRNKRSGRDDSGCLKHTGSERYCDMLCFLLLMWLLNIAIWFTKPDGQSRPMNDYLCMSCTWMAGTEHKINIQLSHYPEIQWGRRCVITDDSQHRATRRHGWEYVAYTTSIIRIKNTYMCASWKVITKHLIKKRILAISAPPSIYTRKEIYSHHKLLLLLFRHIHLRSIWQHRSALVGT